METERFVARRSREQPGLWVLSGMIDENSDLSFFEALQGPVRLQLRDVRRVNSYGVRAWMEGIRKVSPAVSLELVECSRATIDQVNMVAGFTGKGRVVSFYAPLICTLCSHEREELFQTDDTRQRGKLRDVSCPECKGQMQLDDLEDHYLFFVREG